MTRFARAKGSKASNEKAPEDGTPWEVMKEQLLRAKKDGEENKKRHEAEQQRIVNYENFLKERRVQKKPATWCDFPNEHDDNNTNKKNVPKAKKKNEKSLDDEATLADQKDKAGVKGETKKKKNKKRKCDNMEDSNTSNNITQNGTEDTAEPLKKKKKKSKNKHTEQTQEVQPTADDSMLDKGTLLKKKKIKKKNMAMKSIDETNPDIKLNATNEVIKPVENNNTGKSNKNKHKPNLNDADNTKTVNKQNKQKAKKKKKLVDGQPVRRKEINDKSFQLIINGKEVELVRFDGFPIMKKDGDRLEELKSNMIKKGIPKSEIQRTMKLERRRAEKALARMKRDVCYNCRKGGHNLSDCPELKSKIPGNDGAEGVCFKCGSTEHRQFECKVQRDKEFRFATCFICKEPGHIARQCPDNPKGLYPNGGSCKLCGDVTHLRKDCPTANTKKEETSMKLQTLDSTDNIEDIGVQIKATVTGESTKKPKKIKF